MIVQEQEMKPTCDVIEIGHSRGQEINHNVDYAQKAFNWPEPYHDIILNCYSNWSIFFQKHRKWTTFFLKEMGNDVLAFGNECLEWQIDLKHQKFMYI